MPMKLTAIATAIGCASFAGCQTYEVTVLDRTTGKPPEAATVSFNYSGMLMIGKPFSGLTEVDADGHARASIGSLNGNKHELSLHLYLGEFNDVKAKSKSLKPGETLADVVPHAWWRLTTPKKGQQTLAILQYPELVEPAFLRFDVWVERK